MHALDRFLELDEQLPGFQLSPQRDRPPLQPAHFLEAIVFEHPLEAAKRIARVAAVDWYHPVSVRPTATLTLSPIAQHGADRLAILVACSRLPRTGALGAMMTKEATTSRDQDIHKGAIEDERPSKGTNAPALDANGLPNDKKKIAEDAVAARADETTG